MSQSEQVQTNEEREHPVAITIDGEQYTAPRHKMTASQILQLADLDPAKNYLVQKHGREQTSYQNEPDKVITLHPNETFISVPLPDTTVS